MRIYHNLNFINIWSDKTLFFNLELGQGMAFKLQTGVAKGLKWKVKKFWWIIQTFVETTMEKMVRRPFSSPP